MPASPSDVLFVTRPLCPPWDDSSKLLPYLVADRMTGVRVSVTTPKASPLNSPGVVSEELFPSSRPHRMSGMSKARLAYRLARGIMPPIVHFFFGPRGPLLTTARVFARFRPDVKVVQTIMSLPSRDDDLRGALFGDVVVAWSRDAAALAERMARGGSRVKRVVHVPPGVAVLDPMDESRKRKTRVELGLPADRKVVVYAGDLEFSNGAAVTAAAASKVVETSPAYFVFACRRKTGESLAAEKRLGEDVASLADRGRARVMGRVERFTDLLRCADALVFPMETTRGRTDIPLALLEGLSAGIPAIVCSDTPMRELVDGGAAIGVPPLDPDALADALNGLLKADDRARVLGAAGRRYVLDRHTAETMADAHQRLYQQLLQI